MTDHEIATNLIQNNSSVLDYGCGDCHFFDFLKNKRVEIEMVGFDKDKKYIEIGKGKNYHVVNSLKNLNKKFDFVVSNQVVEHMNVEEISKFFQTGFDLLNEKGRLIISTLNGNEFYSIKHVWNDPTHVRPYNKIALESAANYFGFKLVKYIKHHIRINPLKLFINFILGFSIYSGITLVFEKKNT